MKKLFLSVIILCSVFVAKAQCPNVYTTYISSVYCGGTAPNIMLSNSDAGVTYQLYIGGGATGSPISGSGGTLNFGASPTYYGMSAGYISVIATLGSCSLTMNDSVNLIFGIPAMLGGSVHVCGGDTIRVYDTVEHGTWTSSNPAIVTVGGVTTYYGSTVDVIGVAVGSATLTYSITSSCGTHYTTTTVVVDSMAPTPTVTGPTSVCLGAPATYTSSLSGMGGTWSVSDASIATINPAFGSLIGVSVGMVTVSYSIYGTCGFSTGTLSVTVSTGSSVIAGPFALALGDTALLTSTISSPAWSISPSSVATISSSGAVTGLSYGVSSILCSSGSACGLKKLPIVPPGTIIADSFYVILTHNCSGPLLNVVANSLTTLNLKTYYGDGASDYRAVAGCYAAYCTDTFSHAYATSGTYTIKNVLYYGTTPVDSISYSYHHILCHDIAHSFFHDVNSNCTYESGTDFMNPTHIDIQIDSNGVVIDTLSATSGLFYQAFGSAGDVYTFRVLSPYLYISCPSSGIISDTISGAGYSYQGSAIPLESTSISGFDLIENLASNTGRHAIHGDLVISNPYATATGALVTFHFDSRYSFYASTPSPVSVSGSTVTWYLGAVSGSTTPTHITYWLEVPGGYSTWLTPGDTVRTNIAVTPTSGDIDTTSNYINILDTVMASYDPNFVAVTPAGNIFNGTKLHYTVHFENDGNDTAQNIYVMDTLSDNVDPSTLNIEMATAAMNVTYLHFGTHTAVKFEFPNIKLLDSSHHNQCTGFVKFNVKARAGLADGTLIPDRAGIYFDDNEVVMTNSVTNTVVIPSIAISTAHASSCIGDTVRFTATPHSVANTHYQWYVGSTPVGTDTTYYASSTLATGSVVVCKMTSVQDATVVLFSNYIAVSVFPYLTAGLITGPVTVCTGSAITLSDSVTGGTWAVAGSHATVSAGIVTGVAGGADTVAYTVTNFCGSATVTHAITVNTTVATHDSIAVTRDTVCSGDTVTFTVFPTNGGSSPFFQWQRFGVNIDTGISFTYVPTLGDVITCNMASSAICPAPAVVTSNSISMMVIPSVTPSVSIIVTPSDSISYFGQLVTFFATVTYGGSATTYQWYNHGMPIPGATSSSYNTSVTSNDTVYCVITSNIPCASTNTATSNSVVIYADYLSVHDIQTLSGTFSVFPNPNTGAFTLSGHVNSDDAMAIEVRDVTAKLVYTGEASPVGGVVNKAIQLNDGLPAGNYFIRLISRNGAVVMPFVKE